MFYLTPQERKLIAVVTAVLVVGMAIQLFFRSAEPTVKLEYPRSSSSININSAHADELQKLSGIGSVLAGRIIEYRQQHGPFTSFDELRKVKGLTVKRLECIKEDIVL